MSNMIFNIKGEIRFISLVDEKENRWLSPIFG